MTGSVTSKSTVSPTCALAEETVRRSEEHTSELQSLRHLVCRLLLEKKNKRGVCRARRVASAHVRWRQRSVRAAPCEAARARSEPLTTGDSEAGSFLLFFFLNNAAPPEISPFSLPAALPI